MTDLTPEALAALDALAAAATPGPWAMESNDDDGAAVFADDGGTGTAYIAREMWQGESEGEADAAYIAAADPSTVRALIAALTEARANIAHLRGMGREDTAWNEMKRRGDAAEARLAAVRALHGDHDQDGHCDECGERRPCTTVRALDGAS